jgi:protoporphyrinogen oxidase/SAM-dependent methyltransferase
MSPSSAVVIGGGITGLVAARRLAADGVAVTLLESAPVLGGLVRGCTVGGHAVERYYHHLFPHEADILQLLDELGLGDRVRWFPASMSVLTDGRLWPFTTATDLLRFGPLRPLDRIRAGLGALVLGRPHDWEALDSVPAAEWLRASTGAAVTEAIWEPLLRAKFGPAAPRVPAAWIWARIAQRAGARRSRGPELLGYLEGGFGLLFDALERDLQTAGVTVLTSTPAHSIVVAEGAVRGVVTDAGTIGADEVVFCGALPQLAPLLAASPELVDERWSAARSLGAMCVVLDLPRAVTGAFWTNVCDDALPFGGIIELTSLVPPSWFGGRHVVYLSRYFTADEDLAGVDPEAEADRWLAALERAVPAFRADDVAERHVFRTPFAAPLVEVPQLPRIPPLRGDLAGLVVATTAQIYPQDRGMSEGVRLGAAAAQAVLGTAWSCPACGWRDADARWPVMASSEVECGVSAASFRPSADRFGEAIGTVVSCRRCGHGSLASPPDDEAVAAAYAHAADPVSLDVVVGQGRTAARALALVERHIEPGRLLDVGCWTGSLLEAAARRGWRATGVEPSGWAVDRALARGLDVTHGTLDDLALPAASVRLITCCDVLEHLVDPAAALARFAELVEPGGGLYLTVPDAGSRLARALGRRWWSVLPMHVQHFTRSSARRLVEAHGFEVLAVRSHAKAFSARYYAGRLTAFAPPAGRAVRRGLDALGQSDRLIAPSFGDRLQLVARRREGSGSLVP